MTEPSGSRWGERLRLLATLGSAAIVLTFVFMALQAEQEEPDAPVDPFGPLPGYPSCAGMVPTRMEPAPEGLALPRSAVITRVRPRGPTIRVRGYVPMTPASLRRHYQRREDITVLQIEDEIIEAEALLSDGSFRSYVKAQAVCDLGSRIIAVVAAEQAAGGVPTPAGSPPAQSSPPG